ncbi:hypothetical protein VTK56DRAFT_6344 [Thermocarpiscus australiensis]
MPATDGAAGPRGISLGKRKRGFVAPDESTIAAIDSTSAPSPQASAASNSPRIPIPPTTTIAATTTTTRPRKRNSKKPTPAQSQSQSKEETNPPPWPPYLTHLEKTHRALNLVATFFSARRHVPPTLDTLRPAVEAHTGRPLLVEDVAAVVALRAGTAAAGGGGGGGRRGEEEDGCGLSTWTRRLLHGLRGRLRWKLSRVGCRHGD